MPAENWWIPSADKMPRTLIIGYGNPLRGDDAVGLLAAERIPGALALHQLTPELMDPISQAERVIFLDATARGEAGTIHRRKVGQAVSPASTFTHQAAPEALLAGARLLFGHAPDAWLFTVSGANFELSGDLSAPVAKALDRLVEVVAHLVARP
jgi:hydrogenase maturation protease